jgi:hypothetical protein
MININVDVALTHFNSRKTWTDQNVINSKSFNTKINGVVVIISKGTSLSGPCISNVESLWALPDVSVRISRVTANGYFGSSSLLQLAEKVLVVRFHEVEPLLLGDVFEAQFDALT